MLEVYKGKSAKAYENYFFRDLARRLSEVFRERNLDGLLIGMPQVKNQDNLQIDCVLLTDSRIVLIDFKNFGGTLKLPTTETGFENDQWSVVSAGKETTLKAGSCKNPYRQLGRQRNMLIKKLRKEIPNFDKNSTYCLVCFQEQIKVAGVIPRKHVAFNIADSRNIYDKLVDIVEIEEVKIERNYLSTENKAKFMQKVFSAPKYNLDNYHHEIASQKISLENQTPKITTDILNGVKEFLKSKNQLLVLSGNVQSGKTAMIPQIRDMSFELGYSNVPVFAYSNRFKNKMLRSCPELDEVESLYGAIFDFENKEKDEVTYKEIIPLKSRVDGTDEFEEMGKEVFIIDDSHLISNASFSNTDIQFGTGQLLNDIFSYLRLDEFPSRKVIFLGDKNKLSYQNDKHNIFDMAYLKDKVRNLGISSDIIRLDMPINDHGSDIVDLCNEIASKIDASQYNELIINNRPSVKIINDNADKKSILQKVYVSPQDNTGAPSNKIIVYKKKDARNINLWIKKNLLKNGSSLACKDILVFDKQVEIASQNSIYDTEIIDIGTFAEVAQINTKASIVEEILVESNKIKLTFIPCRLRLRNGKLAELFVLANSLDNGENDNTELHKAQKILLNKLKSEYLSTHPFDNSEEFRRMLAKGTGYYYFSKQNNTYRQAKDRRRLTKEEVEYRKRIEDELQDPRNLHFKISNAAYVKYGWALTVSKAMAHSFDNVYFEVREDEKRGRTNKTYYKWLYTGISLAERKINLMNWKNITPFLKTKFDDVDADTEIKDNGTTYKFENGDFSDDEFAEVLSTKLADSGWKVTEIKAFNYQRRVTLQNNSTKVTLNFYYNKKGEVKLPKLVSGEQADLLKITEMLREEKDISALSICNTIKDMKQFLAEKKITMFISESNAWYILCEFIAGDEKLQVKIDYTARGSITNFLFNAGSSDLYRKIIELIQGMYE